MVQFGVPTVEGAMKLGREAAECISNTFMKVFSLEFKFNLRSFVLPFPSNYVNFLRGCQKFRLVNGLIFYILYVEDLCSDGI